MSATKCPSNPTGGERYIVRKIQGDNVTELTQLGSTSFSKTGRLIMQYAQTLKTSNYVTGRGSTEGYSVYSENPNRSDNARLLYRLEMVRIGGDAEISARKGTARINRQQLISVLPVKPAANTETAQTTETTETVNLPAANTESKSSVTGEKPETTVPPVLSEKEVMAANKAKKLAEMQAKKNGK